MKNFHPKTKNIHVCMIIHLCRHPNIRVNVELLHFFYSFMHRSFIYANEKKVYVKRHYAIFLSHQRALTTITNEKFDVFFRTSQKVIFPVSKEVRRVLTGGFPRLFDVCY